MIRPRLWTVAVAFLLVPWLQARAEEEAPGDETGVVAAVRADTSLYADTGRLRLTITFRPKGPLPTRCRVLLHLTRPRSGAVVVDSDHVPPTPTTKWEPGETVEYRIDNIVPAEPDGSRPALVVLIGLVDPTRENGFEGRLLLEKAKAPFGDRRYAVARIERATPEVKTVESLLERAAKLEKDGRGAEAFHVREEAMAVAATTAEKLAVTRTLLPQKPFEAEPVTGPERVRMDRLIAAEKLRYLRDRASALLRQKELKLAYRVMERIGGVAEEERNTRVAGEPGAVKRAQKDLVDLRSRLLALPKDDEPEYKAAAERAEGDPQRLLAAARKALRRVRLHVARGLLKDILYGAKNPEKLKDEARELVAKIEERLVRELSREQEQRLAKETDHPAFHRLGTAVSGRFVYLGPEGLVASIPPGSRHRFDVASLLLTDLHGRAAVAPGERVIVFWKETWDFGGATAGGSIINVGRANPDARSTRVDTSLFYHEFTHCVDDARPVHGHKGGLSEGIADVGSIFVREMFSVDRGRFERLAEGPRKAFKRYYLDREEAYWLIPGYAPSAGLLLEILARHAPGPDGHAEWTRLGTFYRTYRSLRARSPRTHRIMAHVGLALEQGLGPDVWSTLDELRFPVDRNSAQELADQYGSQEAALRSLAMRGHVGGLLSLADGAAPRFLAARARYAALALLDRANQAASARAVEARKLLGVVEAFHVIGPFFGKTGEPLAEVFPPEHELDLSKEYLTHGDVARWRVPARGATHYAKMDGRGVVRLDYGYPDDAVTYALAHVTVPRTLDALAWIGADDEVALWVNDVAVQRNRGRRPLVPDFERWPIRLRAGRNRLLLKIRNHRARTGFSLRLTRPDGVAIEGLETDLEPPRTVDVPAPAEEPRWQTIFEDRYARRSLGRRYEVAAGDFRIRNKVLRGEKGRGGAGWRPFSVRPGFPQDTPAALCWLRLGAKEVPADFTWRIRLEKDTLPKIALTWDGEGDRETLSGWSLVLLPRKDGKSLVARLERYDIPHAVTAVPAPETWSSRDIVVRRVDGRLTVTLGGAAVFDGVSAPPLSRRAFGMAVWGTEPGLVGTTLSVRRP